MEEKKWVIKNISQNKFISAEGLGNGLYTANAEDAMALDDKDEAIMMHTQLTYMHADKFSVLECRLQDGKPVCN